MITLKVTGIKEVRKLMNNLGPEVNKKVGKDGTISLAKNLQGRIKRRYTMAGYGKGESSGKGWKSIQSKPTAKGAIVQVGVDAPWIPMLEKGVPSHWVSPYTIKKHLQNPGSTMGERAPKGEYGGRPIWWHWKGPFVEPAMNSFKPQIPQLLTKFVQQAIKNAGGK